MRVLITGANGQLGQELQHLSSLHPEIQFIFFSKEQWDICQLDLSETIIKQSKADFLINTAAYTKVDLAEDEKEYCFQLNAEAPNLLAKLCKSARIKLIHISTDYVFNSDTLKPIIENETKNPKGVYASSKSLGEDWVMDEYPDSLIIRTSWLYSSFGHNFVKTMYKLATPGKILNIVSDQIGSPTYAKNLAEVIVQMLNQLDKNNTENLSGYFHYSNQGSCSWYEFAQEIFRYLNIDVHLNRISSEEYNAKSWRPLYSSLDCTKIKNVFKIEIPHWKESLHECLDLIRANEYKKRV